jgi:hypothetical protein
MADKLVDILGFLQPDSGNNWSAGIFLDGNAKIMYAFEDAKISEDFSYYVDDPSLAPAPVAIDPKNLIGSHSALRAASNQKAASVKVENTGPKTYAELYKYLNDRKLLPDVPDKNNLPPVIVGYAGSSTNKQNIIVNINQRPIFQRVYYSKWPCFKDLETSKLLPYLLTIYGDVKSYEQILLQGKVDQANKKEKALVENVSSVSQEVADNAKDGTWNKNQIPACFLPDPAPALPGPPSQTIYGTLNKPPTVDDANIFLPSSEPKALNPSESLDKLTAEGGTVKSSVTETVTTKSVETVSGGGATVRTSFAADDPRAKMTYAQLDALPNGAGQTEFKIPGKDSVTTATDSISSTVSQVKTPTGTDVVSKLEVDSKIKVETLKLPTVAKPKFVKDGLGDNWSPDKFKPETIAGNTKFVDPTTGNIGSTEQLAAVNNLKGSLPDVPKPNIPSLSDFAPPTNITNADAALTKLTGENIGSLNPNSAIQSPSSLVQGATGGLLGGGLGAGIGALAGGGKGALMGGLSGAALGGGLAIGGVGGGLLAGAGLGGGIGAIAGGGKGAAIGAVTGGALGAAAAKLASVKIGMPKPNIPKPPNAPRIKVVKIKHPSDIKGAQQLLNLQKPKLGQ